MSKIPEDITPVIREIDEELKAEGVPPVGRPMNAIMKFGQRFNMSILFTEPRPGTPEDLIGSWEYAKKFMSGMSKSMATASNLIRLPMQSSPCRPMVIYGN